MKYLEELINCDTIINNLNRKRNEIYEQKQNEAQNIFNKNRKKLEFMDLQIRTKTYSYPFLYEDDSNLIKFIFNPKNSCSRIEIEVIDNKKTVATQGKTTKSEIDEAVRIVNKILKEG